MLILLKIGDGFVSTKTDFNGTLIMRGYDISQVLSLLLIRYGEKALSASYDIAVL